MIVRALQWKLDDIRASKQLANRKKLKNIDEYSKDILHRDWF